MRAAVVKRSDQFTILFNGPSLSHLLRLGRPDWSRVRPVRHGLAAVRPLLLAAARGGRGGGRRRRGSPRRRPDGGRGRLRRRRRRKRDALLGPDQDLLLHTQQVRGGIRIVGTTYYYLVYCTLVCSE